MSSGVPVLAVESIWREFEVPRRGGWRRARPAPVVAVSDVSFDVRPGEVLGIVGESGSGKTTIARMLVGLVAPTRGTVRLKGRDVARFSAEEMRRELRPVVRMVFQDPDAVLNPGYTVGEALERALRLYAAKEGAAERVASHLERMGLDPRFAAKYPDELSGGEKRRIGVARALLTDPAVIVADEPLSGLDVVLQEQVLSLFKREQEERGFALVLVSHDLERVNQVCDRVLVMRGGQLVEVLTIRRDRRWTGDQFRHPYSVELQAAALDGAGAPEGLAGAADEDGTTTSKGGGCTFARACRVSAVAGGASRCQRVQPPLVSVGRDHSVACHFPERL